MNITIKDKEYKLKYTIRAMFIFEKMANKIFNIESLLDWYIFYYSMILANNPDCDMLFDEFIDECDNDPTLVIQMQEYLNREMKINNQMKKEDGDLKKN